PATIRTIVAEFLPRPPGAAATRIMKAGSVMKANWLFVLMPPTRPPMSRFSVSAIFRHRRSPSEYFTGSACELPMARRRALCGLLLASAVLACGVGWLWMVSRYPVSRARFEQVRVGMTRDEVIRTVGRPPGDYSNGLCVTPATGLRFWHHAQWLC